MPAWRNGIRVCLKNRFPQGIEGSSPSTGITHPFLSTTVFPERHPPTHRLVGLLEIHRRLPHLPSVFLSGQIGGNQE
jgi:hypothetical protein